MTETAKAKAESAKAKKAAETRESIVNVCIRMFAERGFVSTSLDEIGRAAGITKGAIYWHFENKDALFTAILSRIREIWDEEVLQPLSAEGSPRRKLQQLFDHYEELFTEDPFVLPVPAPRADGCGRPLRAAGRQGVRRNRRNDRQGDRRRRQPRRISSGRRKPTRWRD